jgi:hypothetical protein
MVDKPTSPFAGLDKALLRSTKQSPPGLPEKPPKRPTKPQNTDAMTPRHHDTTIPCNHATMTPSYHKPKTISLMWYEKLLSRLEKKPQPIALH